MTFVSVDDGDKIGMSDGIWKRTQEKWRWNEWQVGAPQIGPSRQHLYSKLGPLHHHVIISFVYRSTKTAHWICSKSKIQ
jgi:hypothetical protein